MESDFVKLFSTFSRFTRPQSRDNGKVQKKTIKKSGNLGWWSNSSLCLFSATCCIKKGEGAQNKFIAPFCNCLAWEIFIAMGKKFCPLPRVSSIKHVTWSEFLKLWKCVTEVKFMISHSPLKSHRQKSLLNFFFIAVTSWNHRNGNRERHIMHS